MCLLVIPWFMLIFKHQIKCKFSKIDNATFNLVVQTINMLVYTINTHQSLDGDGYLGRGRPRCHSHQIPH